MIRIQHIYFLQTSKRNSRLYGKKKLLNRIFRRYCIALRAFSRNIDMMSSKSRKWDQKIKKISAAFPFFQFSFVALLSHWYQINIGAKRPQHVLKRAEMQSETRSQQSFGANSVASVARACPQPSRSKIDLKALILPFERSINRFSDLNSLGDIAV